MNKVCRRRFLQAAGGSAAALIAASSTGQPTEPEEKVAKFRLGIVTYNIAAAWDLPTILQICKNVGLSPVELRTTHKHDVEPSLSKDQRREVRHQELGIVGRKLPRLAFEVSSGTPIRFRCEDAEEACRSLPAVLPPLMRTRT